jgi:hypothetical protein
MKTAGNAILILPALPLPLRAADGAAGPVAEGLATLLLLVSAAVILWGGAFVRAGYPRWYSLLMLVPLLNLYWAGRLTLEAGYRIWYVLLIGLSIYWPLRLSYEKEWPAEKRRRTERAMAAWRDTTLTMEPQIRRTSPMVALAGIWVWTFDNALRILESPDLQSAVKFEVPSGTELQLGAVSEIAGREWIEAMLPDGTAGHVLATSVRSHAAISRKASPDQ